MYKKKLMTVVVSMALLTASYTVGSAYEETTVKSEQTEQVTTSKKSAEAPQDTKEAAPAAEQPKQEQREFYIPRRNREEALHGSEFEIRLRNAFTQRATSDQIFSRLARAVATSCARLH